MIVVLGRIDIVTYRQLFLLIRLRKRWSTSLLGSIIALESVSFALNVELLHVLVTFRCIMLASHLLADIKVVLIVGKLVMPFLL